MLHTINIFHGTDRLQKILPRWLQHKKRAQFPGCTNGKYGERMSALAEPLTSRCEIARGTHLEPPKNVAATTAKKRPGSKTSFGFIFWQDLQVSEASSFQGSVSENPESYLFAGHPLPLGGGNFFWGLGLKIEETFRGAHSPPPLGSADPAPPHLSFNQDSIKGQVGGSSPPPQSGPGGGHPTLYSGAV